MRFKEKLLQILFIFFPALQNKVRNDLKKIIKGFKSSPKIADIGGRKSPYTVGLKASVTIVDKPPSTNVQKKLNLGIDNQRLVEIKTQRSNIDDIILCDITSDISQVINEKFDIIVAVEVIEHIENHEEMLKNIYSIMKKDAILYLTTPNGDYIKNEPPNYNPDHIKHYKRTELYELLIKYFSNVEVNYGIKMGKNWRNSGRSWSIISPLKLMHTFYSARLNQLESIGMENTKHRTAHLFATARKV